MVKIKTINIRKLGFNEFAEKPVVDVETIDAIESDNNRCKLRPSMVGIFYKRSARRQLQYFCEHGGGIRRRRVQPGI